MTGCEKKYFFYYYFLKCYIIFLKISNVTAKRLFGTYGWRKAVQERRSTSQPSQLLRAFIWGKNWPLCPSQQCLRMLSLSSLDRVVPASWASQSGEILAGLEGWGHHYRLSGGLTSGSPQPRPLLVYPNQTFVSHVNGLTSFVRKLRKSWLAQGSLGGE